MEQPIIIINALRKWSFDHLTKDSEVFGSDVGLEPPRGIAELSDVVEDKDI